MTTVYQLDQSGKVAFETIRPSSGPDTWYDPNGNAVSKPATPVYADNYQVIRYYADGSLLLYQAHTADGLFVDIVFAEGTGGPNVAYGPANQYVHGAVTTVKYENDSYTVQDSLGTADANGNANLTSYKLSGGAVHVAATTTGSGDTAHSTITVENSKHGAADPLKLEYDGNANGLIGQDSASLIGNDAASLIGQDSASLIGQDSAGLKALEASALIGQDSASLIGQDSAGLIGQDSAGFTAQTRTVMATMITSLTSASDTSVLGDRTLEDNGTVSGGANAAADLVVQDVLNELYNLVYGTSHAFFDFAADDHPEGTPGTLAVGSSTHGALEVLHDRDAFKVHLAAGHSYLFDLKGHSTGDGSLIDPWFRLYDSSNHVLSQNDDGGAGTNARIIFTADHTGDYFIEASGYHEVSIGDYAISAATTGSIAIDPIAGDDILDSTEQAAAASTGLVVGGTTSGLHPGRTVTVTIEGGSSLLTYTGQIGADANWSITIPGADEAGLAPGGYTALVGVTGADGLTVAQNFAHFTVAVVPPTIAIDPIAGDNILDTGEQALYQASGLVVTGTTTDAEAGDTVTLTLEGTGSSGPLIGTYTGTVAANGHWRITVAGADEAALKLGSQLMLASVENHAGGEGQTSEDFTVQRCLPPSISLDKVAGDDVISAAEEAALAGSGGMVVSGKTANVEAGQTVSIKFNGKTYHVTVGADGTWSQTIAAADIGTANLGQGYYTLSATVQNAVHTNVYADELIRVGQPHYLMPFDVGDGTYFDGELLISRNGGEASAHLLLDADPTRTDTREIGANNFVSLDNKLYFVANDSVEGYALWASEGTKAGTRLVKDVDTQLSGPPGGGSQ